MNKKDKLKDISYSYIKFKHENGLSYGAYTIDDIFNSNYGKNESIFKGLPIPVDHGGFNDFYNRFAKIRTYYNIRNISRKKYIDSCFKWFRNFLTIGLRQFIFYQCDEDKW